MKKIKLGCPNPECPNHKKNAKLKHNLTNCPICGSSLVHVCKNKKCHTLVEDDDKLYCVLCNADRRKLLFSGNTGNRHLFCSA